MSTPTQNYANHPRFPVLYTLSGLALVVAACLRGYLLLREPSLGNASVFLLALALVGLGWSMRVGDITLQDRLIRAEMRLRLERLLGAQHRAEVERLELKQLIALRFASDAELPALFDEVRRGELRDPDAIKRKVRDWQADHLRV